MLKAFKSSLFIFLKLSVFLALLITVGGITLFYKTSKTPLILDEYKPYIRETLSSMMGGIDVDFDHAAFQWKQIHKPFYISVQNLKVIGADHDALSIQVPSAHIKLDPLMLIRGKFIPSKLEVFDALISLKLRTPAPSVQAQSPGMMSHFDPFFAFLDNPQHLLMIKNIEVINAKTVVEGLPEALSFLRESVVHFSVKREEKTYTTTLNVQAGPVVLEGHATYDQDQKIWEMTAHHSNVPLLCALGSPPSAHVSPASLKLQTSGKSSLQYQSDVGVRTAALSLEGSKGTVGGAPYFSKPLKIDDVHVDARYDKDGLHLSAFKFKVDGSPVEVSGTGALDDNQSAIRISLDGSVKDLPLKDLQHLWPTALAPVPRTWVTENIKTGRVPFADVHLALKVKNFITDPEWDIERLFGKIDIHQVTVHYMKGMPEASGVNGTATYDSKTFHIAVNHGTCHGQTIEKGTVVITKMDEKDQDIAIDLALKGTVKSALELIDHEPLKYAKSIGMNPKTTTGQSTTHLKLDFPLERTVTLDQVKVDIASVLTHAAFDAPLESIPLRVSAGNFTMKVNEARLLFEGHSLVNQSKAHLEWQRNFNASQSFDNKLTVNGDFDEKMWAHLGLEKIGSMEGVAPLHLVYTDHKKEGNLALKLPLKDLKLSVLGAKKEKGIEGSFESEAVFKGGALHHLKRFDFMAGDTISIKGNANFSPSSMLPSKVSFDTFKLGKTLLKPKLELNKNKTYKLTIKGGVLDLEAILDQLEGESTAAQFKESFEANITLDQLYLLGEKPLRKVIAEISHNDGLLRYLNMRGFFKTGENERTLFVTLHSPNLRQRVLEVSTNHFGELMQSLGVSDRLLGGRLAITATHNNQENSPWIGRFKVYNFNLKDPPVLGQLLSLAFPTGLVDLVSDKGMPFSSFSTRFKYMPHLIQLSEGRAKGSSLGLTISGSIIPKTKDLKLQGTLMPAYFLNTLIAKIPLLGEIITGGKDEGIFGVTYTITGNYDKPKISVNPLSVLTPGLIRKIFSADEEGFEEDVDPLSNKEDD